MTEWYYQVMEDVVGPLTGHELLERVRLGDVKQDTPIRKDDSQWVPAEQVNGLFDAAHRSEQENVCPYCGHKIDKPPTRCGHCDRRIVFSGGQPPQPAETETETKQPTIDELERRANRQDVIKYSILLVIWLGLLIAAPYLIYLAQSGYLFFDGDLAFVSGVVVAVVVGAAYYWIVRAA